MSLAFQAGLKGNTKTVGSTGRKKNLETVYNILV